jgi:hypothetical protein
MSEMRKSFLKGYILTLLSEGALAGASTPTAAAKIVLSRVAEDVPAVVKEIVGQVAVNGLDELKRRASMVHAKLGEKIGEVIDRVKVRGFGEFWKDMQATYARGVDENAKR